MGLPASLPASPPPWRCGRPAPSSSPSSSTRHHVISSVCLDVNELLVLSSFFPSLCSLPHMKYNFVLNLTAYPFSNELLLMIYWSLPQPLIVDVIDESPLGFLNRIRLRWRRARGRTTFIKCPVPPSLARSPKAVPQSGSSIAIAGERNECLWAHLDGTGALVSAPTFLNSSNAAAAPFSNIIRLPSLLLLLWGP